MRVLENLKPLALLWLRVALGVIFFYEGYQKLFGAPASALAAFPRMGFPSYFAYVSGTLELFGAVLLVLGLFTRVAALLLAAEMAIVLAKVELPKGGIYAVRNYELSLALCAATFALVAAGAGVLSVDAATFERSGKSRSKAAKG
jgi:putative oxidoreductase